MAQWTLIALSVLFLSRVRATTLWSDIGEELDEINVCNDELLCKDIYALDDGHWNETAIVSPNHELGLDRFFRMKCQCDADCVHYGDCCLDAAERYSSTRLDEIDESWTCLPLRSKDIFWERDETYTVYTVGKCPRDWPTDDEAQSIEQLCESEYLDQSKHTYLKDVPVFSLLTNRTYANIYCAICHSDADRLAKWNISIGCNHDLDQLNITREMVFKQDNYSPTQRMWITVVEDIHIGCTLYVDQMKNFTDYLQSTKSRRCIRNINECDPSWPIPSDRLKCESYTALVFGYPESKFRQRLYRNPHCAKCNGIDANDTTCFSVSVASKARMLFDPAWIPSSSFSFSMIFDFGFGALNTLPSNLKCKENEIVDHVHNRCHAVICGALFVNVNGTCIRRNDYLVETEQSYLNSSCHRFVITENKDYIALENGSIWLNVTSQVLDAEEFEPDGRGNVSICTDRLTQDYYFRYSAGSLQRLLSDICLMASVICLALHIVIHAVLPKLCNLPGKNLLSLSVALFFGQLLFLIGMGVRDHVAYEVCATIGVLTHWFYLAAFFWMNIMGFDICRTFSSSRWLVRRHRAHGQSSRSTFARYSLYAWGLPTVIVSVGALLDFGQFVEEYAPSYGTQVCWISNRRGLGVLFILPVAVILVENLVLFTHTVHSILQQREAAQFAVESNQSYRKSTPGLQPPLLTESAKCRVTRTDKQQIRFILYIKLGLIMGLGWVFGFLAALARIPALWYPFILFNGLQGAFIFAAFDCKRKIYYMLYYWATKRHHPADSSSNSRATANSSVTKMSVSSQRTSTTVASSLMSAAGSAAAPHTVRESFIHQKQPQNV